MGTQSVNVHTHKCMCTHMQAQTHTCMHKHIYPQSMEEDAGNENPVKEKPIGPVKEFFLAYNCEYFLTH